MWVAEQSVSLRGRPLLLCNDVEKMLQSKVMKCIFSPPAPTPPALTICFNTATRRGPEGSRELLAQLKNRSGPLDIHRRKDLWVFFDWHEVCAAVLAGVVAIKSSVLLSGSQTIACHIPSHDICSKTFAKYFCWRLSVPSCNIACNASDRLYVFFGTTEWQLNVFQQYCYSFNAIGLLSKTTDALTKWG